MNFYLNHCLKTSVDFTLKPGGFETNLMKKLIVFHSFIVEINMKNMENHEHVFVMGKVALYCEYEGCLAVQNVQTGEIMIPAIPYDPSKPIPEIFEGMHPKEVNAFFEIPKYS